MEFAMTKIALGLLAAGALSLAALTAPASAAPLHTTGPAIHISHSGVTHAQYRRHRRHCTVRKVVERRHGKRIVKQVRVCR
jgi:hypothetical protein